MEELFLKRIVVREQENTADRPNDAYLNNLPVLCDLKELVFHTPVTFFVGENGTGKSTLLEAIAIKCGFNPEGGTKNFSFSTNETHSGLYRRLKIVRGSRRERDGFFLRAESYYNAATYIEELDEIPAFSPKISASYGGKSLHRQSHGESFLSLVTHRFGGNGLYILDEPEAALSPAKLMTLLIRFRELVESGSQLLVATHSPILMAYPGATIYQLDETGIHRTEYQNTEHYQISKQFLDAPERMLKFLFGE